MTGTAMELMLVAALVAGPAADRPVPGGPAAAGSIASGPVDAAFPRYVIYLHGRIVQEQQDARPKSAEYGYYELEKILQAFRDRGFMVTGDMRPKAATVGESADQVVTQVRKLLAARVPADHITVVGASMGASIAFFASARLQNPGVRFGTLGACLSENVRALVAEHGIGPSGHLLSIREESDDLSNSCPAWKGDPKVPNLVAREIVLSTGLRHGFLYRPLPEWLNPIADWADQKELDSTSAAPAELEPFAFLIGEWPATGAGQPGAGTGTATFTRGVQDKVIVRTSYADYPAAGDKPATRHDDLMVIYAAPGGGARADYYDSEGHVIRYAVQSPAPGQVVFLSDAAGGGPRFRLSYTLAAPDVLKGEFAIAPPGTPEAFKPYLTWESHKKGEGAK